MKIVKKKEIPEIDKTYYQVEKIYCDECNKEIKETLDYLKESNKNRFGFEQDKIIEYKEANQLLDYITNLQKENEDYKSRCEKAIPMLKELNIKLKDILKIGIDIKEISDIETILYGGDE